MDDKEVARAWREEQVDRAFTKGIFREYGKIGLVKFCSSLVLCHYRVFLSENISSRRKQNKRQNQKVLADADSAHAAGGTLVGSPVAVELYYHFCVMREKVCFVLEKCPPIGGLFLLPKKGETRR